MNDQLSSFWKDSVVACGNTTDFLGRTEETVKTSQLAETQKMIST